MCNVSATETNPEPSIWHQSLRKKNMSFGAKLLTFPFTHLTLEEVTIFIIGIGTNSGLCFAFLTRAISAKMTILELIISDLLPWDPLYNEGVYHWAHVQSFDQSRRIPPCRLVLPLQECSLVGTDVGHYVPTPLGSSTCFSPNLCAADLLKFSDTCPIRLFTTSQES